MENGPHAAAGTPAAIATTRRDALRHLGWNQLCGQLVQRLRSSPARDRLGSELTEPDEGHHESGESLFVAEIEVERARARLAELDGVEALDRAAQASPDDRILRDGLARLVDLAEATSAANEGASLDPLELWAVLEMLEVGQTFVDLVARARDEARASGAERALVGIDALIAGAAEGWTSEDDVRGWLPPALRSQLAASLELGGELQQPRIADAASPELRSARERVRAAKQSLVTRADRILRKTSVAKVLQDAYWTEREGRVVLPVRRDGLGTLRRDGRRAIIHGSSASGNTLFVEPEALVEANNAFREGQNEARAEEHRVRVALSRAVGVAVEPLMRLQAALIRFDVMQARLAISRELEGVPPRLEPVASGGARRPEICLLGARHPLMVLDGVDVVANDIVLEAGHGLVISGPNAGGKTVALKTLGLCLLMAQAGIRLPTAAPGSLPMFREVVTDVGDDQSIAANLSTFSAHLSHVMQALSAAKRNGPSTLVLLDEVAVGTDPEQGAALAEAILLALVEAGATVVATTHYDRLKLLASPEAGRPFHNAAVGFDLENLRPTFRLTMGVPGSSSAIAVARRLGLPDSVLAHAETLLDDESLKVDVLLQAMDAERQALAEARTSLEREQARIQDRDRRVQQREQRAIDGARSRKTKAYDAATTELRQLESELREKRKRLRREGDDPQLPTRAEATGSARARLDSLREPQPARCDEERPPETVAVGDRVRVVSMGSEGDVVAVKGGKVTVQLGNSRVTVGLDALAPNAAPPPEKRRSRGTAAGKPIHEYRSRGTARPGARHFGSDAVPVEEGFENACDLRGTRAEDAADAIEDFISEALTRDQDIIVIRHGHGSGALRSVLREHLARLPHVRRHRGGLPQEGGDAVTVAELG